jgi:hypothetical protein
LTTLKYEATYEGIIQAIVEKLGSSLTNAPYPDGWNGIITALRDCPGGAERPGGYRTSIQGVIEVIADKFLGGGDMVGRYPFTYEGLRNSLIDALVPDGTNRPYAATFEGILAVILDKTVP